MYKTRTPKTHCKHGHAFDAANTYIDYAGYRVCRPCRHVSVDRRRRRVRALNFYQAIEYLGGVCVDCGYHDHLDALEFDHVRGEKKFNVGSMLHVSWNVIKEELDKCALRCANCHAIRTRSTSQPYKNTQTLSRERGIR